jgi:hypothetical protein
MLAESYLRDKVFEWFESYVAAWFKNRCEDDTKKKKVMTNTTHFKTVLINMFGDIDRQQAIEQEVLQLIQWESTFNYASRFKQLLERIEWDDDNFNMTLFEWELKMNVQFEVVKAESYTTLKEMIIKTVQIDNQLYVFRQMRRNRNSWIAKEKKKKERDFYESMSMKLDITRQVNDNEKHRRQTKNQCFYCKKKEHYVRNCQKKKNNSKKSDRLRAIKEHEWLEERKSQEEFDITKIRFRLRATTRVDESETKISETSSEQQSIETLVKEVMNKENQKFQKHKTLTWQKCENVQKEKRHANRMYDIEKSLQWPECAYHWEKKTEEVKNSQHARHDEYSLWACECKYHAELQKKEEKWIQENSDHSYHFMHCKECEHCRKSKSEEEAMLDSQNRSNPAHSHHDIVNWIFCYDDTCSIHLSEKKKSEWFSEFGRSKKHKLWVTITSEENDDWEIKSYHSEDDSTEQWNYEQYWTEYLQQRENETRIEKLEDGIDEVRRVTKRHRQRIKKLMKETIEKERKEAQAKRRVKELEKELTKAEEDAEQSDSTTSSVDEIDELMINKQSRKDCSIQN